MKRLKWSVGIGIGFLILGLLQGASVSFTAGKATYAQVDSTSFASANVVTNMTPTSLLVSWALFLADPTNTAAIGIGPNTNANLYPVQPGQAFELPTPNRGGGQGSQRLFDLNDWSVKSTGVAQAYHILYEKGL